MSRGLSDSLNAKPLIQAASMPTQVMKISDVNQGLVNKRSSLDDRSTTAPVTNWMLLLLRYIGKVNWIPGYAEGPGLI